MDIVTLFSLILDSVVAITALVTFVFIYLQLKDSNKQTKALVQSIRSSTYQSIVHSERELWLELMKKEVFLRGHIGEYSVALKYNISPELLLSVGLVCAHYENIYYQFRQGVIPIELWPEWRSAISGNLNKPMVQKVWPEIKTWFWDEFYGFVDKEIAKQKEKN